jgi:hypothetical protein
MTCYYPIICVCVFEMSGGVFLHVDVLKIYGSVFRAWELCLVKCDERRSKMAKCFAASLLCYEIALRLGTALPRAPSCSYVAVMKIAFNHLKYKERQVR